MHSLLMAATLSALLFALAASASATLLTAPHARLVFVRHGQSTWNQENLFTGWADVELSDLGVEEATAGGREICNANLEFDLVFTSMLKRAQDTCRIVLEQSEQLDVPVVKDFRLNERHYVRQQRGRVASHLRGVGAALGRAAI